MAADPPPLTPDLRAYLLTVLQEMRDGPIGDHTPLWFIAGRFAAIEAMAEHIKQME